LTLEKPYDIPFTFTSQGVVISQFIER